MSDVTLRPCIAARECSCPPRMAERPRCPACRRTRGVALLARFEQAVERNLMAMGRPADNPLLGEFLRTEQHGLGTASR